MFNIISFIVLSVIPLLPLMPLIGLRGLMELITVPLLPLLPLIGLMELITVPLIGFVREYLKKNKKTKRLNLIFDLDNTLIMSMEINKYNSMNISHKPEITYLKSSSSSNVRVVWVRPMLRIVLYLLNKITNIYLYTRSEKYYAKCVLKNLKIDKYFINCKYKEDCYDTKDVKIFYPKIKKIFDLEKNINKLSRLYNIDNIADETKNKIKIFESELKKSLEEYKVLMNDFVSASVLIDDLKTNKCENQDFYHIKYFNFGMIYDYELIKLLLYAINRIYITPNILFIRKLIFYK